MLTAPLTRDLVLVGGGHAHALVLRRWGMGPLPGARLTLIDPGPVTAYTGMLPGHVAGHYRRDELDIDLVRLARFAGARLIIAAATGLDRDRGVVRTDLGRDVPYDVLSLDVGITSALTDIPGFVEHGIGAKPLAAFADRWERFRSENAGQGTVTVIGGGVGGVELTLAMAHALDGTGRGRCRIVEHGRLLDGVPARARDHLRRQLDRYRVDVHEGATVERIGAADVTLGGGPTLPSALTVAAAGARPWPWLAATGLAATDGYLDVDATLLTSDPAIFAAGDCAHLTFAPRPKAGVYAVRAAPVLTDNLRAALSGGTPRRFRPQGDYLKLVSLGARAAVATKWGMAVRAPFLWRLKDRIDRRFMENLTELPTMSAAPPRRAALGRTDDPSGTRPLCGGCGAKVGGTTLARVLADLPRTIRDDVSALPGDDAAVLRMGGVRQVISTDHLRAFTHDPATLTRITALHALGDIWAMGARPQAALASVILPRMSDALQERWLAEIMAAATAAFAEAGAVVAGGHTTMGAELTVGFAVTGLVPDRPITLAGARPGDALLLTRPIGSGTILAAEMALVARGRDVAALLRQMSVPQGDAAALLSDPGGGAHAMTDVTGFGLAGHLLGICDASGVGAEIVLRRVPLYAGARHLAAQQVRSTLFEANRHLAARIVPRTTPDAGPDAGPNAGSVTDRDDLAARTDLLFDPQTAGGLLAAIPSRTAPDLLSRIRALGHDAALIGTVTDGPPGITLR